MQPKWPWDRSCSRCGAHPILANQIAAFHSTGFVHSKFGFTCLQGDGWVWQTSLQTRHWQNEAKEAFARSLEDGSHGGKCLAGKRWPWWVLESQDLWKAVCEVLPHSLGQRQARPWKQRAHFGAMQKFVYCGQGHCECRKAPARLQSPSIAWGQRQQASSLFHQANGLWPFFLSVFLLVKPFGHSEFLRFLWKNPRTPCSMQSRKLLCSWVVGTFTKTMKDCYGGWQRRRITLASSPMKIQWLALAKL